MFHLDDVNLGFENQFFSYKLIFPKFNSFPELLLVVYAEPRE